MASQPNQIATIPESHEAAHFGLMQRQARMFAMSPLIPEALRKGTPEQAMANCYIAMSIADRMGEDRMTVMQNIHIIHGTAGFKSSYMIARANASGKFSDEIDWEISGEGDKLKAVAFATLAKSGRRVEMEVDMAMAKAEGWTSNKKYQTMPKVMLRYRSAAFLIRLYAPEVMLGHQTSEEIEDIVISGRQITQERPALTAALIEEAGADPETGEIIEQEGKPADQVGEITTLESAKAEIDAAEMVPDVNSRVSALLPLLGDDDADALREHAMARIEVLKAA